MGYVVAVMMRPLAVVCPLWYGLCGRCSCVMAESNAVLVTVLDDLMNRRDSIVGGSGSRDGQCGE